MKKSIEVFVSTHFNSIVEASSGKIQQDDAKDLLTKAIIGGELETLDPPHCADWVANRLIPNCAYIDEVGYTKMCVDALKILHTTAGTDYGSSRQRDMGQLWADMTRGYLGELAMKMIFKSRWNVGIDLDHEAGNLSDYLPLDIHRVTHDGNPPRPPKIKISVKTTKSIGIWLDIPGDQFNHSDVHMLVKVCAGRDHLFSFFKSISVFKDKVLRKGVESGSLTETESADLFTRLPSFRPIPAYVCGFVLKDEKYSRLSYKGRAGKKNFEISGWRGPYDPKDLIEIKSNNQITGKVGFAGIGEFTEQKRYLFNTGSLLWKSSDWKSVIEKL